MGVSHRRIQQLYKEFQHTGIIHAPKMPGRRPLPVTDEDVKMVLEEHRCDPAGILNVARRLRRNHDIR